jgi:hypothetical protein
MAKTKVQENQLLTPEERAACLEITSGDGPHSQRATALLALDEGSTQMQAAGQAGLTKGQVRYWLGKFRQERLAIFPEELLASPQPEPAAEPDMEVNLPTQPVDQTPAPLESPTPAGLFKAETEEKDKPVTGTDKAKKAKKGKKGSKKKAKKTQPAEDSQKKSKASKKKKAKKKGGKKAKKGKKAGDKKQSPGDKKKSKKKAK